MSDLKKIMAQWQTKVANVQSEKEANAFLKEMIPHLGEMSELFFGSDSKASETDEEGIDWIGELQEYIAETIRLYLAYHVKGNLERVNLSLNKENPPVIMLTIDGQDYNIDFEEIKNGTDRNNRDAHRECYFRSESNWLEFRESNPSIELPLAGDDLCIRLKSSFPSASTHYIIEE